MFSIQACFQCWKDKNHCGDNLCVLISNQFLTTVKLVIANTQLSRTIKISYLKWSLEDFNIYAQGYNGKAFLTDHFITLHVMGLLLSSNNSQFCQIGYFIIPSIQAKALNFPNKNRFDKKVFSMTNIDSDYSLESNNVFKWYELFQCWNNETIIAI